MVGATLLGDIRCIEDHLLVLVWGWLSDLGDMSEANSFSLEEYNLSYDSINSLDEYSQDFSIHTLEVEMSLDRTFSVEE